MLTILKDHILFTNCSHANGFALHLLLFRLHFLEAGANYKPPHVKDKQIYSNWSSGEVGDRVRSRKMRENERERIITEGNSVKDDRLSWVYSIPVKVSYTYSESIGI